MYKIENILIAHGVKTQAIKTPKGILIMANNEDGTYKAFEINTELKEIYNYLGY